MGPIVFQLNISKTLTLSTFVFPLDAYLLTPNTDQMLHKAIFKWSKASLKSDFLYC